MRSAWHDNDKNYDEVVRVAKRLIEIANGSNIRIISLGQSPAWIAQAVKFSNSKVEVKKIAFSGKFLSGQGEGAKTFYLDKRFDGEKDLKGRPLHEKKYREYLTKKQMSPKQIIDKFEKEGTCTLLLEFAGSGRGLASFLSVLYLWAQEEKCLRELNSAIKICMLHAKDNLQFEQIILHGFDDIDISIDYEAVDHSIFVNRDKGKDSDRLVPVYENNQWNHPPQKPNNTDYLSSIKGKLQDKLKENNVELTLDKNNKKSIVLISRLKNHLEFLKNKKNFSLNLFGSSIKNTIEALTLVISCLEENNNIAFTKKQLAILKSGYLGEIFKESKFNLDQMKFSDKSLEPPIQSPKLGNSN